MTDRGNDEDRLLPQRRRLQLALPSERVTSSFQSRLAARGVKGLAVVCPSFVADCLETLEEVGIRAREQWLALGGEALALVPCVNAAPEWVRAAAGMVRSGSPG